MWIGGSVQVYFQWGTISFIDFWGKGANIRETAVLEQTGDHVED